MGLEPSLHFLEANGLLAPTLGHDGKVMKVFEQPLVSRHGKNYTFLLPFLINHKFLQGRFHRILAHFEITTPVYNRLVKRAKLKRAALEGGATAD
jgi:hypothetical protein